MIAVEFRIRHHRFGPSSSSRVDELFQDGRRTGITYRLERRGTSYALLELRYGDEVFDLLTGDPDDANAWVAARLPA